MKILDIVHSTLAEHLLHTATLLTIPSYLCPYAVLALLLLVSSCNSIYDYPGNCLPDQSTVSLNVKVAFNINDLQSIASSGTTRTVSPDQCLRFIFEIYQYGEGDRPVLRHEVTTSQTNPREVSLNTVFMLHAAKYYVLVWADYLNKEHKTDQFYNTQSSLHYITFTEPFGANTDNRDCFAGLVEADLLPYPDKKGAHAEVTVMLCRPVAKYALIASDIDQYTATSAGNSRNRPLSTINNHTAVIHYSGYTPNSFDVRASQPNDSYTGLWYISRCQLLNNKEALICFDYPLVNGTKSQAKVNLQIYDDRGTLVNEIDDILFPIRRDSLTVVRSDYFTGKSSPGISINPGYEGSIDISIPD